MQGECKKASLLVFFAEPQPFLCKKCGNGGDFLTDVGCWRYKMRHLQIKEGQLQTKLGGLKDWT